MNEIKIKTEYITLGQLLKFTGMAYSGGDIKQMLENSVIFVDGEKENRRGKKLYPGAIIKIDNMEFKII